MRTSAVLTFARRRSSFAAGKGSALVLDIGDELASVVPIYDGFVLRKGEYSKAPSEADYVQINGSAVDSLALRPSQLSKSSPRLDACCPSWFFTSSSSTRSPLRLFPNTLSSRRRLLSLMLLPGPCSG